MELFFIFYVMEMFDGFYTVTIRSTSNVFAGILLNDPSNRRETGSLLKFQNLINLP